MKPRALVTATLLVGTMGIVTIPACTNSAVVTYCQEMCDCEGCNDDDVDACEAKYSGELDAADEWDCKSEYDALLQCQADEGRCEGQGSAKRFGVIDDCGDELDDYADCVDDASDLNEGTTASGESTSAASSGSGGGTDNVAACNAFVESVMCGTVNAGMYVDCSQYSATPCDISGYFNCLSSNTTCDNGILNTTGWTQCAAQAQCQ